MREIKFRGKRPNSGKWVYGLLYYSIDHSYKIVEYMEVAPTMQDPCGDCINIFHDIDLNTVGQYTGLKDKNGKEIYEGDVFKLGAEKEVFEVRFEHGCFLAYRNGKQFGIVGELQVCFIEIIGNIYDNPELLEQ